MGILTSLRRKALAPVAHRDASPSFTTEPRAQAPQTPHAPQYDLRKVAFGVPAQALRPSDAGNRLPDLWRGRMERDFKTDLSDVRLHVSQKPRLIGAPAYTQGSHIHVVPGLAPPGNSFAQRVMTHELTHVLQQRDGRVARGATVNADPALETEAHAAGDRAAAGRASASPYRPGPVAAAAPRTPSLPAAAPVQPFWEKVGSTYRWIEGEPGEEYKQMMETRRRGTVEHPVYRARNNASDPSTLAVVGRAFGSSSPTTARPLVTNAQLPSFSPGIPPKTKSANPVAVPAKAPMSLAQRPGAPRPGGSPPGPGGSGGGPASSLKPKLMPKSVMISPSGGIASHVTAASLHAGPPSPRPQPAPIKQPQTIVHVATDPPAIGHGPSVPLHADPAPSSPSASTMIAPAPNPPVGNINALPSPRAAPSDADDGFIPMPGGDFSDDEDAKKPAAKETPQERDARMAREALEAARDANRAAKKSKKEDAKDRGRVNEKPKSYQEGGVNWMPAAEETDLYPRVNTSPTGGRQAGAPDLTRHHINPKSQLAEFYNTAAKNGHLAAFDGLMNAAVDQHEQRRNRNQFASNSEALTRSREQILAEWDNLKSAGNKPKDRVAAQALGQMYQWMPGNLMEGPSSRADDPNHGFERGAAPVIGAGPFQHHQAASAAMATYLGQSQSQQAAGRNGGGPAAGQLAHAQAAVNSLMAATAARPDEPYAYNPAHWEEVEGQADEKHMGGGGSAGSTASAGGAAPNKKYRIKQQKNSTGH